MTGGGVRLLIMWLSVEVIEVIQSAVARVLMASLSIYVMLLIVKPICIFIFVNPFSVLFSIIIMAF